MLILEKEFNLKWRWSHLKKKSIYSLKAHLSEIAVWCKKASHGYSESHGGGGYVAPTQGHYSGK